jgi:hypothetical protein
MFRTLNPREATALPDSTEKPEWQRTLRIDYADIFALGAEQRGRAWDEDRYLAYNELQKLRENGRLKCGICGENLVDDVGEVQQITLPIMAEWKRPTGKIDIGHFNARPAETLCKCGCKILPSPSGPLAVTYLCSVDARKDFMPLLREVKSVALIEKLPESILPAVAYIPTRRLYWVIADGRLIPPQA